MEEAVVLVCKGLRSFCKEDFFFIFFVSTWLISQCDFYELEVQTRMPVLKRIAEYYQTKHCGIMARLPQMCMGCTHSIGVSL